MCRIRTKQPCPHKHTEYQAPELDTHVIEGMVCLDCGEELPIPEPDFDLIGKEENL